MTLICGLHKCPSKCHPQSDYQNRACEAVVPNTCPAGHKNDYKCAKTPPTTCKTCEKEARRLRTLQAAQFERQLKLDRTKEDHERHLEAVEKQIVEEQQKIKDKQLAHDRDVALEQKKRDLAAAREAAASLTPTASTSTGSSFLSSFLPNIFFSSSASTSAAAPNATGSPTTPSASTSTAAPNSATPTSPNPSATPSNGISPPNVPGIPELFIHLVPITSRNRVAPSEERLWC